jgi:hypothetical protein
VSAVEVFGGIILQVYANDKAKRKTGGAPEAFLENGIIFS